MSQRFGKFARIRGKPNCFSTHKKAIPVIVDEVIDDADIVLEILDARFVQETRHLKIEEKIQKKGKILIRVLNKADLIDVSKMEKNKELEELKPYIFFSCTDRTNVARLRNLIKIEAKRLRGSGFPENVEDKVRQSVKVGVVGYQNTGKSSIINLLYGKGVARTSPEAGFTKGMQKIRLTRGILLIDTPGIIPESEYHSTSRLGKHAQIGVRTWDKVTDPDFIIHDLMQKYPGVFEKFYDIPAEGDSEVLIQELGKRKGILKKHAEVDIDKTARYILREFQDGKIRVD